MVCNLSEGDITIEEVGERMVSVWEMVVWKSCMGGYVRDVSIRR